MIKPTLELEDSGVKLKHLLASRLKATEQEVKCCYALISPLMGEFWHWAEVSQSPPSFPLRGAELALVCIWRLSLKINP